MRLSIYGMERTEWLQLAKWILRDWRNDDYPGPVLSSHNRWMVQVPRLWRIYYKKGGRAQSAEEEKRSFQGMLENLFCPIIEATLRPEENPEIAELLTHIVGFDSVDDEGAAEVCIHFLLKGRGKKVMFDFCVGCAHACASGRIYTMGYCILYFLTWRTENTHTYIYTGTIRLHTSLRMDTGKKSSLLLAAVLPMG